MNQMSIILFLLERRTWVFFFFWIAEDMDHYSKISVNYILKFVGFWILYFGVSKFVFCLLEIIFHLHQTIPPSIFLINFHIKFSCMFCSSNKMMLRGIMKITWHYFIKRIKHPWQTYVALNQKNMNIEIVDGNKI